MKTMKDYRIACMYDSLIKNGKERVVGVVE